MHYRINFYTTTPFPLLPERKDTFAFAILPRTLSPTDSLNIDFAGVVVLVCIYTDSC